MLLLRPAVVARRGAGLSAAETAGVGAGG